MIWRNAEERLPAFLKECDPAVHLFEPHCRIILDALRTVYGNTQETLWGSVVTCVREMGKLDEVGGKDGLNRVYMAAEFKEKNSAIFNHYVGMLKTYAEARQFNPPRSVQQFTGGIGCVYQNKAKSKSWQADYIGQAVVRGIKYQMSMNIAPQAEFINVRLEPPTR